MTADGDAIFLKNCWYVAAWDHELIDGAKLARTILEKPVVLYQGESGRVVAMEDRCCHRGAPLSMGRIEGDCIRCMYHGMKYDPSGKLHPDPGPGRDPGQARRAQLSGGRARPPGLDLDGRPGARRSESLIVDYEPLHDPAWRGMPAYMHYDANWLLIVDNLSDFAHLAFVHTKTLGGSEEYAYQTRPLNIERLADGFRVERWHMNSDPPPFHKKVIADKTAKVDRRNIGRMLVPGIFFLESMFAPAGTGAEKGNIAGARQYRNCQFMTPETRRTTHFFWNYLHNFDLDDPEHRAVAVQQPARGVHGRQGDHRGAAEAVRPRARHHLAGDRRRCAAGALPARLRPAPRRRAGQGRRGGLSADQPSTGGRSLRSTSGSTGFCR